MTIKNSKIYMLAGSAVLALISVMPAHATATFAGNAYTANDGVLTIIQVGVNGVAISNGNTSESGFAANAAANTNLIPTDTIAKLGVGASTVETTYTTPPSQVVSTSTIPTATITVGVDLGDIPLVVPIVGSTTLGAELATLDPSLLLDTVTITATNLSSGAEADTTGSEASGNITSLGISDSLGLLDAFDGTGSLSANAYASPNSDIDVGLNPGKLDSLIDAIPIAGPGLEAILAPLLNSIGDIDIANLILNQQGTVPGYTESAYDNAINLSVVGWPNLGLDADQLIVAHSAAGVSNGDPAPAPEPSGLVVSLAAATMLAGLVCIRKRSSLVM